ncbi:DEAD/DEAH box helicase [Mycoplasmopsis lipofaciens]|uniref:DEAD/DEAH box helicase n=1 Tax=Mycoplasmopsis lipofaciens TaxID=114884 RepID=UPI000482F870|nr:DEAD/DEAH box helicase [Mycoplasmopsis lipofaciens]
MKQIFALDKNEIEKVDIKKIIDSKYKRLVNNLLDIKSRGDNATFYKTSNICCDLRKIINLKKNKEIFTDVKFEIPIKKSYETSSLNALKNINSVDGFIEWAKENNTSITAKMSENLAKDNEKWLNIYKRKILNNNKDFIKTWKTNSKIIEEIYSQTNIWPLYIGTYFLKYRKDDVYFYAPYILKAVKIVVNHNSVYLETLDENIIVNEKIQYLIDQHSSYKLPILVDGENVTIQQAVEQLNLQTKEILNNESSDFVYDPFQELTKKNFENTSQLELLPGTVLVQANFGGTKLRETMIKLIANDKMESLINIDDLHNYEKDAYEKTIDGYTIARATPSDFSQEKAIIGTLSNSSIIIGPPGTGKSQTIANILINIAKNNKKALFISQKKVALDVVLKRLGKYQNMLFQFSEGNKINKTEKEYFYKPVIEYFTEINNVFKLNKLEKFNSTFFSKDEFSYFNAKNEIGEIFNKDLIAYTNIKNAGNLDANINHIINFYQLFNKFYSKNDFLRIYKYFDKMSKSNLAKRLEHIYKERLNDSPYSMSFSQSYKLAKQLMKYHKKYLSIYAIEDLVQLSNFIRLNSFIQFDKKEKEYNRFLDRRNLDNTTPELLEAIYQNNAYSSKLKLDNYRSKSESHRQKLNEFFGRLERRVTPPYIITSLFDDIIKSVYNIFVGTPEILGNFIDFDNDHFDYVIFDEASQIFIEKAIPFISISDKVVVAGDDQQMQPSNWFSTRDNNEDEFTEEEITSLLDWAIHNHLPKYLLEMNYRSNSSELVLFSSKEFYQSGLKGLDSYVKKGKTSVDVIDVNGEWIDNKNEAECAKLINVCEKNLKKYNSIILLAFNRKQQDFIREQISLISPKIFEALEDKVILRNIENIQGDEAELVIASVGYTSATALHSTYIGSKKGRNALNVAITRAKDKMIVIKSIYATDIDAKNDNLLTFKRWLTYIQMSVDKQKSYTKNVINSYNENKNANSQFVYDLTSWINEQNFGKEIKIQLDYCIGSYNIDMALLDNKNNFIVGLSLDTTADRFEIQDLIDHRIKNDFMTVKGYPIYRVSSFRFNEHKASLTKFIQTLINK